MRRWKKKRAPAPGVKSEINVTPLVDVVLVLLIIFMVVTPMLSRGVKVELPEAEHHTKSHDTGEQILVSVDSERRVFLEADQIPLDGLESAARAVLAERRASGRTQEIHVRGDKSLRYGEVRGVLERLHAAGARSVALGTDDPKRAR